MTIWHVYGGETESPLNDLIDTFNETVGRAQNIRVQVGSVTNTNTIHEAVLASAYGEPGATGAAGHVRVLSQDRAGTAGCGYPRRLPGLFLGCGAG